MLCSRHQSRLQGLLQLLQRRKHCSLGSAQSNASQVCIIAFDYTVLYKEHQCCDNVGWATENPSCKNLFHLSPKGFLLEDPVQPGVTLEKKRDAEHGVNVFLSSLSCTHCSYSRMAGQADVCSYTVRWLSYLQIYSANLSLTRYQFVYFLPPFSRGLKVIMCVILLLLLLLHPSNGLFSRTPG